MITDVDGIRVGHWTGERTGVTVVLAPSGTIGSGEVRGGAPATRETDLLQPGRLVERVDAVVLTGGSAFGLTAADGVMRWLAERGQGYPTSAGAVPIVVGAAIFDLVASGGAVPSADDGYRAAVDAERGQPCATGPVGAGRAATVGKWRGAGLHVAGGLGSASAACDEWTVGALAVVNAVGDVIAHDGRILAGSAARGDAPSFPAPSLPFENTTLAVVATDAPLTRNDCWLLAQSGHDGLAAALRPAHTRFDGDAVFTLATGLGAHDGVAAAVAVGTVERLRTVAVDVVAAAIRNAVEPAAVTRPNAPG
jgi:L-aminopeptidase/D-esterase-like protein